jgi:tRNA (adenine-N(1)-)-methyltransferase non-catalytic subunit
MGDNIIDPGSFVVIKMHDDKSTNIIKVDGEWKINRKYLDTSPLVGQPFGAIFEIIEDKATDKKKGDRYKNQNGKERKSGYRIVRLPGVNTLDLDVSFADQLSKPPQDNLEGGTSAGNDWYADTNTAQKLEQRDLQDMRDQGVENVDIIRKLVENSETWSSKTSFAQEKWLKRKARKYMPRFRVEKCTPVTMCNVYRTKNAARICGIRPDTLGRMLSHANIHAGCRALIFESCLGLVVGAAAYRMRGHGRIAALYGKNQPHLEIVHKLSMPEEARNVIQPVPCNDVGPASALVAKYGFSTTLEEEEKGVADMAVTDYVPASDSSRPTEEGMGTDVVRSWQKNYNSTGRQLWDRQRVRALLTGGFDSLIIASHCDPLPVLQNAMRLLEKSAAMAIYSEHLEPLNKCYQFLNDNNLALRLSIGDTWMREFQVLPGRTHPSMSMVTSGGYLLVGIYVGGGAEAEEKRSACSSNRANSNKRRRN